MYDYCFNDISVDMVRLETRIMIDKFEEIFSAFKNLPQVEYYQKFSISDYRHNFVFKECKNEKNVFNGLCEYNSFWVGFFHNSAKKMQKQSCVIEFNPNKCDVGFGLLQRILNCFFKDCLNTFVRSLDIAVDLHNVDINNVVCDKCNKRNYVEMVQNGAKTIYMGARGQNGRVKIYDKAKEQKLSDDVKWCRYEITLKFENLRMIQILGDKFDFDVGFPDVYILDDIQCDDVKMKCYLLCIKSGQVKINEFSKDIRKKIKQVLDTLAIKKIDEGLKPQIHNLIINYFTNYIKL